MKTTTRIMATLLLLLATATVQAQDDTAGQQLVVWLKSGEKVYYHLDELPETTFEGTQLAIRSAGRAAVYYQLENVLRYTYEGIVSAVDLLPGVQTVRFSHDGNAVTFDGLGEGTPVMLYGAGGQLLGSERAAGGGVPLTIDISHRPQGVYIVKAGSQTIKLMKR